MADGSRTSSAGTIGGSATSAWARWVLPSISDLIFVAVLGVLVFTVLSVKLLNDAGTGWHIRTGQLILATHSIPGVDPFSSQIQRPWIAWEWLYDVIVGELERAAGLNGVVCFTAVVIAATLAGMLRFVLARGADVVNSLVLTLLAIAASMIHFLARPHVLSWLFALIFFCILDSAETVSQNYDRRIWILPLLMVIWVNVHGGFLLGFVLIGIYWMGSVWTWLRLSDTRIEELLEKIGAGKRARQLTLVGVSTGAATFLNPYGWKLHVHVYRYLTNRFFMEHIEEFQSPNFHGAAQRCFLVILLIAVAALMAGGRKLHLSHSLLILFSIYAALYASRNIPVASIFLVLIVGPMIPTFMLGNFSARMRALDGALRGYLWPTGAALATLGIALGGGRIGSTQVMDAHFGSQRMPVTAVDFIEHNQLHGPILSPDFWGGYLIYRLYPRNSVVIDDRHDFYGEVFLQSYLTMMHVEPGWQDFLKHSGHLVLPRKAALSTVLSRSPDWKTVYFDDVAVVFVTTRVPEAKDKPASQ